MQIYSHLVITAFLAHHIKTQQTPDDGESGAGASGPILHSKVFLLGSVAPDIPLILLMVAFLARDLIAGSLDGSDSSVEYLFRYLFYHDPWVKTAHNLFHAPLLILLYGAIGYWAWRRGWRWGPVVFWFAAACMIHTLIDIPLHYDDGPLLFYPLDWKTRFYGPLSYWDPRRYGIPFTIAEHILVVSLLVYLALNRQRQRRQARLENAG